MSPCGPGRHDFDPVSGWCAHCTTRDDGRLVDARPDRRSGRVLQPGAYEKTEQEESTQCDTAAPTRHVTSSGSAVTA